MTNIDEGKRYERQKKKTVDEENAVKRDGDHTSTFKYRYCSTIGALFTNRAAMKSTVEVATDPRQ